MAYQVILEPGVGQFRKFEPPGVHTIVVSIRGDLKFFCAQIDLRKARERELATLDENSTSSGIAELFNAIRIKSKNLGEKGATPEDHGLSRSRKVEV